MLSREECLRLAQDHQKVLDDALTALREGREKPLHRNTHMNHVQYWQWVARQSLELVLRYINQAEFY